MIKWFTILAALIWALSLSGQSDNTRNFLPPYHFSVDSVSLLATWEAPKIVLLDEDFEGDAFPPAGWADTSLGAGWLCEDDPQYHAWWMVPENTGKIALVNDDWNPNNNGSLDFLYPPEIDLTVADRFSLQFDSYFDGAYGQTAYVKYSVDNGANWQLIRQMDPSLHWQKVEIDLSEFSGTNGISNFKLTFYTNDRPDNLGWWGSGWAIDNVLICSDENPEQVLSYKLFLDSELVGQVTNLHFKYGFGYSTIHTCGILARYPDGCSDTIWQAVQSYCLPKPDRLSGNAPDEAAIMSWSPPLVMYEGPAATINRDVGEIILSFPAPVNSCFGICDDGEYLWISDPALSSDKIYKITYEGVNTGETITINQGQSWIGDMVSDGIFLYVCLVGGQNALAEVYLPTGQTIRTITGDFSVDPQQGLAADFASAEFYIGGWNSNQIWRTDFNGVTIDSAPFDDVSGLTWNPVGGPEHLGSLWVMTKADPDWVWEVLPNDGYATIQTFEIPGAKPNSGAGIEIKTSGLNMGAMWICNHVDNYVYLVDINEFMGYGSGTVPDNLIGFNVYKDGDFRDFIEYTSPDSCGYIDPVDWEDWYEGVVLEYEVTAVYDMSPYGFPGETEESPPDGPAEISLFLSWLEFDFLEDWSAGTFSDNAWFITDSSWQIREDMGNEAPCAAFIPETVMAGYSAALQSFHFLDLSAEEVILEYDVALSSVNPTGNEKLQVQVFDYTNRTWNTVKTITNIEGSFDWMKDSLNIAGAYNQGAFRIRFEAIGENSSDIDYWAVDNIALSSVCPPPENIQAILAPPSEDSVLVSWEEPTPPISEWKQWDDGAPYDGIGFGTEKNSWCDLAIHWTPELLADLKGASITSVGFIPGDVSACFKIALWSGDDSLPFYTQAAGNLNANQWNIFQLDTPQKVDITKDLYIGYMLSTYCEYPISVDNGPAIDSLGNMIRLASGGTWSTLLEVNWNFDWNLNIKAFFERDGVQYESYYRVFRSIDGSDPEMISETMDNEFTDPVSTGNGLYCYSVKALYYDECESDFSPESCLLLTDIPSINNEDNGTVKIYPNPASEVLFIESSEEIKSVRILDSRGGTLELWNPGTLEHWNSGTLEQWNGGRVEIPVIGLTPGLYLVRVETGRCVVGRKVVVIR